MKGIYFLMLLCGGSATMAWGQKKIEPSNYFDVEGHVRQPLQVTQASLSQFAAIQKDSILITSHTNQARSTLRKVKLVRLKDVLAALQIDEPYAKQLSSYYFVCVASDSYKVVFSWNELFNNPAGDQVFLIREHDGQTGKQLQGRMALIAPSDITTGRRYVKGLRKIIVKKIP